MSLTVFGLGPDLQFVTSSTLELSLSTLPWPTVNPQKVTEAS